MYKVTKYPQGTFSWADQVSTDTTKAKAFFTALLGWEADDVPMGDGTFYTMFKKDGENVAGLGPMQAEMQAQGIPSHWNSYVSVDDVDAMVAKIKEHGGTVVAEPFDVFDSGRMLMLQDPSGANLGLWQPKNHIGASLVNTHGAMSWNELATRDLDKAKAFFNALLGWEIEKMDGMDYYVIKNKGRMNGGMLPMTEEWGEMPSHWMVYFSVEDVNASAKKVEELGGKVHVPVTEIEAGHFCVIADPTGGVCTLLQPSAIDPWTE